MVPDSELISSEEVKQILSKNDYKAIKEYKTDKVNDELISQEEAVKILKI